MIIFQKHSNIYTLKATQTLPITIDKAWEFFSSPHNLKDITPKHMGFAITSDTKSTIYTGQIITYKISIMPMIKVNWVTEIAHVKHKSYFIDKQLFGPYSLWHHEHCFKEESGHTLIEDKVSYKIPLGIFGNFVHALFIKKQLHKIFEYRFNALEKIFPAST